MKDRYCDMFDKVRAEETLVEKTLQAAEGRRKKISVKWMGAAAAACAACMVGAVPVLAATVPAFNDALYEISPGTAQFFKPVQMSCEEQGIRMEVQAVYFRENTVDVYVTLQDLQGDRLSLGGNPLESFRLNLPSGDGFAAIQYCEAVEYDEETSTLTMLLSIEALDPQLNPGDKVTFSINKLLGQKESWEGELTEIDLTAVLSDAVWDEETFYKYGGGGEEKWTETMEEHGMLKGTVSQQIPAEGVTFTGAGYVDGELHIQMFYENEGMNNHGQLYLLMPDGEKMHYVGTMIGGLDPNGNEKEYYEDSVFQIEKDVLETCTLYGSFSRYTKGVEGNWNVTFELPERSE